MSGSVRGLLALNLVFAATGLSLVWALRGIRGPRELARMAAPGLLLGAASIGVLGSFVLYDGVALSRSAVLALAVFLALGALGVGTIRRIRAAPAAERARGRVSLPWPAWPLAAVAGVFGVLLLAFAGVQPLSSGGGSALWVTRAAAVAFARTPPGLVLDPAGTHSAQPLFVPAIQAMDFLFAGSVDPASLSLQYWALLVAFLVSVAVLLRNLVPTWLTCLCVCVALFAPQVDASVTSARSDLPLAVFFATAGLFLVLWLEERSGWSLAGFTATLAATLAASVYGQLLAACLVAGGLVALAGASRRRRGSFAGAAAAAAASTAPFVLFAHSRHLRGALVPLVPGSAAAFAHSAWAGLGAAAGTLFGYQLWLVAPLVALGAAVALVALRPAGEPVARLALATIALAVLGLAASAIASRATQGSALAHTAAGGAGEGIALLSAALAPFLLAPLLKLRPTAAGFDASEAPDEGGLARLRRARRPAASRPGGPP